MMTQKLPQKEITPEVVQRELNKLNIRKATGLDKVSGGILKVCNVQLRYVFARLFNLSVNSNGIFALWKMLIICCTPIKQTEGKLDSLQFAYSLTLYSLIC